MLSKPIKDTINYILAVWARWLDHSEEGQIIDKAMMGSLIAWIYP